jgi:hypothetical protein
MKGEKILEEVERVMRPTLPGKSGKCITVHAGRKTRKQGKLDGPVKKNEKDFFQKKLVVLNYISEYSVLYINFAISLFDK